MPLEFMDQPALVEKKRKYSTFRVIPIGGPSDIEKWRELQEIKRIAYDMRQRERERRIHEFEFQISEKLDPGKVRGVSSKEKIRDAKIEISKIKAARLKAEGHSPWKLEIQTEPTLFIRFKNAFKTFWKNAGF